MKRTVVKFLAGTLLAGGLAGSSHAAEIADLDNIPQDLSAIVASSDQPLVTASQQEQAYQDFRKQFFAPWHQPAGARFDTQINEPFERYIAAPGFGENTRPFCSQWYKYLQRQVCLATGGQASSQPATTPSVGYRRAITVRSSNLRELPTNMPRFDSFMRAGEGYPFDTLQVSSIHLGTPLLIIGQTTDGTWLAVKTPFAVGWIPAEDAAEADQDFVTSWESARLGAITRDTTAVKVIIDPNVVAPYSVLMKLDCGAVLPMENSGSMQGMAPIAIFGKAICRRVSIPSDSAAMMPLLATAENICRVAGQMIGQPYGWGGMYGQRDCSSTTKDIFAPFGLYLPRNSSEQAVAGKVISLGQLPPEQREQVILQQGRPLLTLIRVPGHIMLYIGRSKDGRALVLHNFWGVRTLKSDGEEDRLVVGRCSITTLHPGAEVKNINPRKGIMPANIESMIILFPQESSK